MMNVQSCCHRSIFFYISEIKLKVIIEQNSKSELGPVMARLPDSTMSASTVEPSCPPPPAAPDHHQDLRWLQGAHHPHLPCRGGDPEHTPDLNHSSSNSKIAR